MSLQTGETYITAPQLRARFGGRSEYGCGDCSRMSEPIPQTSNGAPLTLFRLSEVEAWGQMNRAKPKQEALNVA